VVGADLASVNRLFNWQKAILDSNLAIKALLSQAGLFSFVIRRGMVKLG
jgi:hypothetical protein